MIGWTVEMKIAVACAIAWVATFALWLVAVGVLLALGLM
jgi:hypothetical protein